MQRSALKNEVQNKAYLGILICVAPLSDNSIISMADIVKVL